jgi:hypothetical protein
MMTTLRRKRLVDAVVVAYVDWRDMCTCVNDAYRLWASDPGDWDSVAFYLYMAALDAEEHAARVYAGLVRRADELAWSEDARADASDGWARGFGRS